MSDAFWNNVSVVSCVIGLVAALAFVITYQRRAGFTWWRQPDGRPNHFGRFLMIRKILLSALFTVVILNRLVGDWPGRAAVIAILMMAFALQTFVPYRLLTEAQKDQQKEEAQQ